MIRYPSHLLTLIGALKALPGVGNKSAERYAFHLLTLSQKELTQIAEAVANIPSKISFCSLCGALVDISTTCPFCTSDRLKQKALCIVGNVKDVFSIEETREYYGLYHVLPALFSPLDGIGPEELKLGSLVQRVKENGILEVIIALDSTLEGDATALLIKETLTDVKVTRLAFGLPIGSALGYIDEGTLAKAFLGRV